MAKTREVRVEEKRQGRIHFRTVRASEPGPDACDAILLDMRL
jgi:hypothetical protein